MRLVVVLAGLSAFGPLTTDLYLPGLPQLGADLDAPAAGVQLTLTTCVLGIAAGQLLIGPLSDVAGRRAPLLGGLLLFIAASSGCALAPSIAVLDVLRLIQGFAGAAGIVIARAMVRDMYSGLEAGRLYAALSSVLPLAPVGDRALRQALRLPQPRRCPPAVGRQLLEPEREVARARRALR
jgi:DHA1 family bicyclomycin/chloramphenicol resistance-like MFS transporter